MTSGAFDQRCARERTCSSSSVRRNSTEAEAAASASSTPSILGETPGHFLKDERSRFRKGAKSRFLKDARSPYKNFLSVSYARGFVKDFERAQRGGARLCASSRDSSASVFTCEAYSASRLPRTRNRQPLDDQDANRGE